MMEMMLPTEITIVKLIRMLVLLLLALLLAEATNSWRARNQRQMIMPA
jgi:hypothetical protein